MSDTRDLDLVPAPVDVVVGLNPAQQIVLVEVFVNQGLRGAAGDATPQDLIDALGYTPANKAGETFGGNITAPGITATAQFFSPGYAQFGGGMYPTPTAKFVLTGDGATYADVTFDAAASTRLRFVYASKLLVFYVDNVAVFSVNAAGNVVAKGSITPNATPAMYAELGVELELPPDPPPPADFGALAGAGDPAAR